MFITLTTRRLKFYTRSYGGGNIWVSIPKIVIDHTNLGMVPFNVSKIWILFISCNFPAVFLFSFCFNLSSFTLIFSFSQSQLSSCYVSLTMSSCNDFSLSRSRTRSRTRFDKNLRVSSVENYTSHRTLTIEESVTVRMLYSLTRLDLTKFYFYVVKQLNPN